MSRERLEFGIDRASFGRGRRGALWTSFVVLASAVMTVAGLGSARFVRVAEAVETESSSWSESSSRKAGERKTLTIDGIEYAFRWIPAGSFMAGSPTRSPVSSGASVTLVTSRTGWPHLVVTSTVRKRSGLRVSLAAGLISHSILAR